MVPRCRGGDASVPPPKPSTEPSAPTGPARPRGPRAQQQMWTSAGCSRRSCAGGGSASTPPPASAATAPAATTTSRSTCSAWISTSARTRTRRSRASGAAASTRWAPTSAPAPPPVLDGSQRRCVTNDTRAMEEDPAVCWQEVGPDLVCGRPRLDRQATYTECCCLYGEAWGMDCALCPARHSDDFEFLCNVLRPPGPGLGPPYEYGPEYPPYYGLPYGPLPFGGPGPRLPPPGLRTDYDPYRLGGGYDPHGDALYAAPPRYEDLEDFEGSRRGPPRSSRPHSPPSAPQDPPPRGSSSPTAWPSGRGEPARTTPRTRRCRRSCAGC
ncbi:latent-transforming growth factor beta-binding protein 4-like [Anas acuta]|uniref:latent-transforming growth factor beta-binding protein 4-like n=1 Tax=Anas acuta TaxID=28680 RepID=UPI0035C9059B